MNKWVESKGKGHYRKVCELMLAHNSKEKVEGADNREAYKSWQRELVRIQANMLNEGLSDPRCLFALPA